MMQKLPQSRQVTAACCCDLKCPLNVVQTIFRSDVVGPTAASVLQLPTTSFVTPLKKKIEYESWEKIV